MTEDELRVYLAPNRIDEYALHEVIGGGYRIYCDTDSTAIIIEDEDKELEVIAAMKAAGVRIVPWAPIDSGE